MNRRNDGSAARRRVVCAFGLAILAVGVPPVRQPRVFVAPRCPSPLFPPERASELLEDPDRDRWQQPERLVRALGLHPGQVVADVGAGSGYLLPHLSRAVGPTGLVIAQEIQREFLPALDRQARALGNVQVVLGTAADPGLHRAVVDCIVLLTVYHEVRRPVAFLTRLRQAVREGGRLAVIDFDPDRGGEPPPPSDHSVRESDLRAEAAAAGWQVVAEHDFLASQFFLVLERTVQKSAGRVREPENALPLHKVRGDIRIRVDHAGEGESW